MEFSSGTYNLTVYPGEITLGRSVDCDIILKDFAVSRTHAQISRDGNQYRIADAKSHSGLYVNNQRVTEHLLKSGDEIVIGTHILIYQSQNNQHSLYLSKTENRVTSKKIQDGDVLFLGRSAANDIHYPDPSLPLVFISLKCTQGTLHIRSLHTQLTSPAGIKKKHFTLLNGEVAHFKSFSLEYANGEIALYRNTLGASLNTRSLYWKHDNFSLSDISLTVNPGECVAILGMSGDGKSTLLNCISGALSPDRGTVVIDGHDSRTTNTSYLEQRAPLYPYLTVFESLYYTTKLVLPADLSTTERKLKAEELLELFDLKEVRDLLNSKLSGGQQKRVALAIELISHPSLLLLDEPTSGLDPLNDSILIDYLSGITNSGHTIVLTTHNYNDLHKFDRIVLLQSGTLIFQGTPHQALEYFNVEHFHHILEKIKHYNALENRDKLKESTLILQEQTDAKLHAHHKWEFSTRHASALLPVTQRFIRQFYRDKGRLLLTITQPFILGTLLLFIFDVQSSHWTMAFTVVICTLWFALSNSIREIVQEKEMLRKELSKEMHIIPYVFAKTLPLTALSFLQAAITFIILRNYCGFNWDLAFSALTLLITALAGTSLGLLFSTFAKTENQALTFLPLLLIPQVLFAGALIEVDLFSYPGLYLSHGIFSKWSYNALKSIFVEITPHIETFLPMLIIAGVCMILQAYLIRALKRKGH